jgi:hypothetical protein
MYPDIVPFRYKSGHTYHRESTQTRARELYMDIGKENRLWYPAMLSKQLIRCRYNIYHYFERMRRASLLI